MTQEKIDYWKSTIEMCEKAMVPRAKAWADLRQGLGLKYDIPGLTDLIYISRFYKIVREIIASVMFRHPYVYIKAEENPRDPESAEILQNASPILEAFGNDALELMDCRPKVQQAGLDALFCYRGWLKMGIVPPGGQGVAPYSGSDTMVEDFTCVEWVPPDQLLTDPLVQPHDFYTSRFVIQKMFPSLDDLTRDPRFENAKTQLAGLKKKAQASAQDKNLALKYRYDDREDVESEVLREAHRLAMTQCAYEVHDRLNQQRFYFVDGIEAPIEEIDHPFLASVAETIPDPIEGESRPLKRRPRPVDRTMKAEGVKARQKFLVDGGFPFMTLCFDLSHEFYWEPPLAYENPIQNAIVKMITRRMDILQRFKRHPLVKRSEWDTNQAHIANVLGKGKDGDPLILDDMDAIKAELQWGSVPEGTGELEQSLLNYEAQTIRTTTSSQAPDTATEVAVDASETELNRNYMQAPVERIYVQIIRNTFSILSDPQFAPTEHHLRMPSDAGQRLTEVALKAWMLTGRYTVNIAAGSANILYETMQKDRAKWVVDQLRASQNVDQLKLDKYIIRAGGEMDAAQLLKDGTNTDAAKAAELELQMFFAYQHDPGVTPGEDHRTHIDLQSPQAVVQHPQFAALAPELQQMVIRLVGAHTQAHQQAIEQEMQGKGQSGGAPASNGRMKGPADSLMSQVQSNAQSTSDLLTRQAQERMGR